jgi:hypothetical protein
MGETNLKETVEQRLSSIGMNAPGELDLSDADFDRYEGDGFSELEVMVTDDEEDEDMVVK